MRLWIKHNSPIFLAIGAGTGVLTTAYLTGRATIKSVEVLEREQNSFVEYIPFTKENVARVWKLYIPAGISGATTIVCIIGLRRVDGAKLAAAQAALGVSQRAYESYRAQVVEELGSKRDQLFKAKAAEQEVNKSTQGLIVAGEGSVLCYEEFTGRIFESDMQSLNRAINEINARILKHDYATLDDFYDLIGLENTMVSGQAGWGSPHLLELEFSSILHKGRPCLAFAYNYVKSL